MDIMEVKDYREPTRGWFYSPKLPSEEALLESIRRTVEDYHGGACDCSGCLEMRARKIWKVGRAVMHRLAKP